MNDNTPLAVGIDFGGTSIKFGVCRGAQLIADGEPIETDAYADSPPEELIAALAGRVADLHQQHPAIRAVGCGVPGLVDFDRGHIHDLTNVRGWEDVQFRGLLEEQTGLQVVVDNDANCMAYAEWRHGAGMEFSNLIAITLGTGVGGGLIIGGKLHRGSHFLAGELGQVSIDHAGEANIYGTPGTLESYVGNREIARHAAERYRDAGIDRLAEDCSPRSLASAAGAGDEVAQQIWQDYANWLGTAISSAIWLLDPQAILIGGGVAAAGDVLFNPLRERLEGILSPVLASDLRLIPAKFGNDAGIIGSAAQALDTVAIA